MIPFQYKKGFYKEYKESYTKNLNEVSTMAASEIVRKKSPRAPSISLDDALDKALKIYDKERLHPTSADIVAQHMGYKDANNGRALGSIASLRYYSLAERVGNGQIAVSKDVESYKYAPSDEMRKAYLGRFLAAPVLFAELLERYSDGLPSDDSLRYELIQRKFLPSTAESVVGIFKKSIEYAKVYETAQIAQSSDNVVPEALSEESDLDTRLERPRHPQPPAAKGPNHPTPSLDEAGEGDVQHDRIPVRLSGGRRAWLLIPRIFHEADKQRLKAQIDLILTEDDPA